ncbi:hypothetical protein BYT27DRAFT_7195757 [Phlegmacium glaucopus]|nr:hypothetical protein BYT27DRAFT_7195757 [Phlegmacium glaucopus]
MECRADRGLVSLWLSYLLYKNFHLETTTPTFLPGRLFQGPGLPPQTPSKHIQYKC